MICYIDTTFEVCVHEIGHALLAQILGVPAQSLSVRRNASGGADGVTDVPAVLAAPDQIQLTVVWGGLLAELEIFGETGLDSAQGSVRARSDRDRLVTLISRTGPAASYMAEQSAKRVLHQYHRELSWSASQVLDLLLRSEDGTVLLDAQSLAALLPARRLTCPLPE